MGTATPLVPWPPPTRVVTSLLSLSITFCYTLGCPILRSCRQPKDGFPSKLLFFGELSKALIWKKENNFFRASLLPLSPRPVSSVWCFIQNHYYAHKPCSESHLQHARLKKKKRTSVLCWLQWPVYLQLPKENNSFRWRIRLKPWIHSNTVFCPSKQ